MILLYSISAFLSFSILLNIFLLIKAKRRKHQTTVTQDAQAMLRDLLNSGAMMHIRVLDAGDFFLKSPRDR